MNTLSEYAPDWDKSMKQEVIGKAMIMSPRPGTIARSQATETDKEEEEQIESPARSRLVRELPRPKKKQLAKSQSDWNLAKERKNIPI